MNQVRRRNATINHPGQRGTPQPQQGNTAGEILFPCVSCSKIRTNFSGAFDTLVYPSTTTLVVQVSLQSDGGLLK